MMTPGEVEFVSQRIAASALARGDRTADEIVEKILVDVPEAREEDVRKMVGLMRSIQDEVKVAIPDMMKKPGDAAYPDLEKWKVEAFMSKAMSMHGTIDKEALDSLIGWTYYYSFLR